MPEKIEIVRGTDQVSATRNNTLLSTVCWRPDDVRHGITHIVCEEGSPVYSDEHTEVPSRNRPLRNQLKCSLATASPVPRVSVHTPTLSKTWP